tara:strand:- start:56 stop:793 length:738 start_codon:yes stop_codon:yes gene_type:complete
MFKVAAIIPARGGSKSIKDKNIAIVGGYPLLAYSIAAARMVPEIEKVVVSTDSPEYAEIAERFGAEVPFLRPAELATDTSTDIDFMSHAIDWFDETYGNNPEYWLHLRPTTPFREPKIISQAILEIEKRPDATALRSGHISPESPFKWFTVNSDGFFANILGNDTDLDKYNGPRQNFPEVIVPNGYVDIIKTSFLKSTGRLHGDKVLGFTSPFCTEVDSIEELKLLEFQMADQASSLKAFLDGEH